MYNTHPHIGTQDEISRPTSAKNGNTGQYWPVLVDSTWRAGSTANDMAA